MSINKAIFAIDNLEDLRDAQSALNARFRELQRRAAVFFQVGDKVSFKSRTGENITGIVNKVNQKTISIKTASTLSNPASNWKVSPSLLRKI
jgi:hypothetical protein